VTLAPIALSCLILICWATIGLCITRLLGRGMYPAQNLLLAPSAGLSVLILLATLLNRLGLPAGAFGIPLIGLAFLISFSYLVYRRPAVRFADLIWWGCSFVIVLALISWPSIIDGFDWISFGNGDMVAYVIGANHFYAHSLYQLPLLGDLLGERDPTWDHTFIYALGEVRWASQLMIAMVMSVTTLKAAQVYMPLQISFHVLVATSAAALIYTNSSRRYVSILTFLVVGTASNLAQGTFNQLMPQDFGIVALLGSIAILLQPYQRNALLRQAILGALYVATLLTAYPELFPFLIVSVLFYAAASIIKRRDVLRTWLLRLGLLSLLCVLFTNFTLVGAFHLLIWEAHVGSAPVLASAELFPYYLTPAGLALGWGLVPYGGVSGSSTFEQFLIVIGIILTGGALALAARGIYLLEAVSFPALVMLAIFVDLYHGKTGFGLFKLAMYSQAFVLTSTIVAVWRIIEPHLARIPRRESWLEKTAIMFVALLALCFIARNCDVTYWYGIASLGQGVVLSEMPGWSENRVVTQLSNIQGTAAGPIVSDAFDRNVAMFEVAYSEQSPLLFFSPHFVGPYPLDGDFNLTPPWSDFLWDGEFRRSLARDVSQHNQFYEAEASIPDGQRSVLDTLVIDPRLAWVLRHNSDAWLLKSANPALLNRWGNTQVATRISLVRLREVTNYLVYASSTRGGYNENTNKRMIWTYQPDAIQDGYMQAIGRYLLFAVINPRGRLRFEINFTSTFQGLGRNSIPAISVIGQKRVWLRPVGDGSARLFSQPVNPITVDGVSFLQLDMGRDGRQFPFHRIGIMRLFGADINFDYRRAVGFIRDITLVPEGRYDSLNAPEEVQNVKTDLQNANLEYSGLYEDGWMAHDARMWLKEPRRACNVVLQALVPEQEASTNSTVSVTLDGSVIYSKGALGGEMDVRVPIACDGRRHKVDVTSSATFNLPGGDGRPASLLLKKVGFE